MPNLFPALPLPVFNGPGAAVNTSTMGRDKTFVVEGLFQGVTIAIEASNDGGATYAPVTVFQGGQDSSTRVIPVAAEFMRTNVSGRAALEPFTANVRVAANDNGGLFAVLTMPAFNGAGPATNVATHGSFSTFIVTGSFIGVQLALQTSEDGADWATAAVFADVGGVASVDEIANFYRVVVVGRNSLVPFTAVAAVGSINDPVTTSAGGGVAVSAGTQLATSGTVIFSNANNVTFGMAGSSVVTATVSFQAIQSISAGTTNATGPQVVFSDGGGITFGAAGNTITGSVAAGSTAPGAIAAGTQTATSGTVLFGNANGVSFGMNASSLVTASYTQSVAPAALSAGTTIASSGTIIFSNANSISFGLNGQTMTASFSATQSTGPSAISAGTTLASSGTVVFSNSNNMSFGMNGNTVTGSAGAITLLSANASMTGPAITFSNANGISFGTSGANVLTASMAGAQGIAAGTQTATSGTVIFSNANGVTFGMAGSATVTASVAAAAALAISAGTTSASAGTVVFSNGGNITWGMAGSTVTASHAALLRIAALSAGGSTGQFVTGQGNTVGSSGSIIFSNANGISFGLSTGGGNFSITARGGGTTVSALSDPGGYAFPNGISDAQISFYRLAQPYYMSVTQARYFLSISAIDSLLSSESFTLSIGVYTMAGSTMSLASSASRTFSYQSLAWTTGNQMRIVTGFTWVLTPGDYLFAVHMRTTNFAGVVSFFGLSSNDVGAALDGNSESQQFVHGWSSGSFSTAMPASLNVTQTNYVRSGPLVFRQPSFGFLGS